MLKCFKCSENIWKKYYDSHVKVCEGKNIWGVQGNIQDQTKGKHIKQMFIKKQSDMKNEILASGSKKSLAQMNENLNQLPTKSSKISKKVSNVTNTQKNLNLKRPSSSTKRNCMQSLEFDNHMKQKILSKLQSTRKKKNQSMLMSRVESSKKKEVMPSNSKNKKNLQAQQRNYRYEKITLSRPKSSGKKQFSAKKEGNLTNNKQKEYYQKYSNYSTLRNNQKNINNPKRIVHNDYLDLNLCNNNSQVLNERKGINKYPKEIKHLLSLNALKEENVKKLLKKRNIKIQKPKQQNYGQPSVQRQNNRVELSKKYLQKEIIKEDLRKQGVFRRDSSSTSKGKYNKSQKEKFRKQEKNIQKDFSSRMEQNQSQISDEYYIYDTEPNNIGRQEQHRSKNQINKERVHQGQKIQRQNLLSNHQLANNQGQKMGQKYPNRGRYNEQTYERQHYTKNQDNETYVENNQDQYPNLRQDRIKFEKRKSGQVINHENIFDPRPSNPMGQQRQIGRSNNDLERKREQRHQNAINYPINQRHNQPSNNYDRRNQNTNTRRQPQIVQPRRASRQQQQRNRPQQRQTRQRPANQPQQSHQAQNQQSRQAETQHNNRQRPNQNTRRQNRNQNSNNNPHRLRNDTLNFISNTLNDQFEVMNEHFNLLNNIFTNFNQYVNVNITTDQGNRTYVFSNGDVRQRRSGRDRRARGNQQANYQIQSDDDSLESGFSSGFSSDTDSYDDDTDYSEAEYYFEGEQQQDQANPGMTDHEIQSIPILKYSKHKHGSNQCTICLVQLNDNQLFRKLYCEHVFHRECIDQWLKRKSACPVCRDKMGIN